MKLPVEVTSYSNEQAREYWENLNTEGIRYPYRGHELKYGNPITLDASAAAEFQFGAQAVWETIVDEIDKKGGISQWMVGQEPHIGDKKDSKNLLNNDAINQQLEDRLNRGLLPPVIYDMILTSENGKPQFKVVEIQSGIGYSTWHRQLLKASGNDPDSQKSYYGPQNPMDVMQFVKESIANNQPTVVIDTDPFFGGSLPDQVGMAKALGNADSLPVSILDIEEEMVNDTEQPRYFYYKYATDSQGKPLFEESTEAVKRPLKTTEKVYVENVLARMTQSDLDKLDQVTTPSQKERILRFLNNSEINWVWHPTWQYIINKSTLVPLYESLINNGHPIAKHFVAIYDEGNYSSLDLAKGYYILKPKDGVSGQGQSTIFVDPMKPASLEVPAGYVLQKRFVPFPVSVKLTEKLRGAYPIPEDDLFTPKRRQQMREYLGWDEDVAMGTLEVRFMQPPYNIGELSGWFMARHAPRYKGPNIHAFTQTNQGPIQDAVYASRKVDDDTFYDDPFGWCPVIIDYNKNNT